MAKRPTRNISIKRDECIVDLIENHNLSYARTGMACGGISRQAVHQRYKKPDYSNAGRRKSPEIKYRYASIAFLLSTGMTMAEVAGEIGIKPNTLRVIMYKFRMRHVVAHRRR